MATGILADQQHRVTIVTVSYNSMLVLPGMLASVPVGTPVVIVDNASDDPGAVQLLAARYGAKLILNPKNAGFGVACNQGAALAETDFLLFLNPDASLGTTALQVLVAAAAQYPHAGGFNPRISNADGSHYFRRRGALVPRREILSSGWPPADAEVPVLSGAALFVRRADFCAIGGFDPAIFLYHEDDDLSQRLRQSRGPLMFIWAADVMHMGGRSTVRSPHSAAFKAWHLARSRVYTCRKHSRPLPFISALLSAFASLLAPDMLISARKRAKNWSYLQGVLSTLRDGGAT